MSKTKRIGPPLKWHGGKHYLAPRIIARMPPHQHYVEPYFGGGSVLLAKDPEGISEVANDLDGLLTNFWRVLQSEALFAQFERIVQAIPFSEQEWEKAAYALRQARLVWPDFSLQAAVDFFVYCRQSMSGRMQCFAPLTKKRLRRGMNEQASAWLSAVEQLPEVHARLQRVVILSHDALDVIREQDSPQTLFYLDPPYLPETRNGHTQGDYACEMTVQQHTLLLSALVELKGHWMLSGYPSLLYDSFFKDYKHVLHTFDLPNNAASGAKRRMTECLWCSF